MSQPLSASILVSSYNYARFLKQAIDSALGQTYPDTEVVVVDDCSTDASREIIVSYRDRIRVVLRQENQGGRATYNEACQYCQGEVIFLLDSDDCLCPTAVEQAMPLFADPAVVKVQWPLWQIDADGGRSGRVVPCHALPEGDLRARVIAEGPWALTTQRTSGNAWLRALLQRVLPVPSGVYADDYLSAWAYALGVVRSLPEPQGYYRVHGQNTYNAKPFDQRLVYDLGHVDRCAAALASFYRSEGIEVDVEHWKRRAWICSVASSAHEIGGLVSASDAFILVDDDNWGTHGVVAGRRALPFPERSGCYGGPPVDTPAAIQELERLRQAGASHIVFAWQSFWWLEVYAALSEYLRSRFRCVLENERLIAFDLRAQLEEAA